MLITHLASLVFVHVHMMQMACGPAGSPESGRADSGQDYTPLISWLPSAWNSPASRGEGNPRLHKSKKLMSPEGVPLQPQPSHLAVYEVTTGTKQRWWVPIQTLAINE